MPTVRWRCRTSAARMIAVVAIAAVAWSQDELPKVAGTVVNVAAEPVAGARLSLHLTRGNTFMLGRHWPDRQLAATTSDASGKFEMRLPERSVLIDELFALVIEHGDYAPEAVYHVTP